ncbi:hypothetical protein BH11BAC3_BH11BAC3_42450 [soil metagenome]
MNITIVKSKITTGEFLKYLIEYFPEVKEDVLDPDYTGLIYLQISALARYANDCTNIKRFDELKRAIDFFEITVDKVDSVTENALYVSFLEHLEFKGLNETEIKKYLKPNHFETWKGLLGH